MDLETTGFVVLIVLGAIGFALLLWVRCSDDGRDAIFLREANRLGLTYSPHHNYAYAHAYEFLRTLDRGENRYAFNVVSGNFKGHMVTLFDFHYETGRVRGGEDNKPVSHYLSVCVLTLTNTFPELLVTRESLFSKLAQAVGSPDIDFESHEFSKQFHVRSADRKFAYDFCNPRMMEYLLANNGLNVEVESASLALVFDTKLHPGFM